MGFSCMGVLSETVARRQTSVHASQKSVCIRLSCVLAASLVALVPHAATIDFKATDTCTACITGAYYANVGFEQLASAPSKCHLQLLC
jgi:hypothetical protein